MVRRSLGESLAVTHPRLFANVLEETRGGLARRCVRPQIRASPRRSRTLRRPRPEARRARRRRTALVAQLLQTGFRTRCSGRQQGAAAVLRAYIEFSFQLRLHLGPLELQALPRQDLQPLRGDAPARPETIAHKGLELSCTSLRLPAIRLAQLPALLTRNGLSHIPSHRVFATRQICPHLVGPILPLAIRSRRPHSGSTPARRDNGKSGRPTGLRISINRTATAITITKR